MTDPGSSALSCRVSPNVRAVSNGSPPLTASVGVPAGVDPRMLAQGVSGLNAFPRRWHSTSFCLRERAHGLEGMRVAASSRAAVPPHGFYPVGGAGRE